MKAAIRWRSPSRRASRTRSLTSRRSSTPSGATVPPRSLSATPLPCPQPGPTSPGLGWGQGWSLALVHLCLPAQFCPDCQPHTDLPQGTEGAAICPRLCPYELISCPPHQPGASGPHVRWTGGRKLLIGWWKKGWGLSPKLARATGLAEVSFWG